MVPLQFDVAHSAYIATTLLQSRPTPIMDAFEARAAEAEALVATLKDRIGTLKALAGVLPPAVVLGCVRAAVDSGLGGWACRCRV